MDSRFLIAFVVCLVGYVIHTVEHLLEYKGHESEKSKASKVIFTVIIFAGYLGWAFMIRFDPIQIDIHSYVALPLGLLVGLTGLMMFALSTRAKKGFYELDHLVTRGIYSRVRNPMYLGVILLHIGLPLAARTLLTLISAAIWIFLILVWKYMEEKDLEERFGEEYLEYKKATFF